jgi:hypothetical protein
MQNRSSSILHIGDAISEDPVLEEEPQEEEVAEPSNDVQGRPLCIPMLFKCITNYGYLLHRYVTK